MSDYRSDSIKVLKGLEAVRTRPGMYIGSTGPTGLHHMIWEIVDNSIDEAMAGYAKNVTLTIHKDGSIEVEDDGRGIPIDIHPETGKSGVETVLTILHAGGKFDHESYKISGGLHGVGASVVNALSEWFRVWVTKQHEVYYLEFRDGGQPQGELSHLGHDASKEHGTKIQFFPDFSIMEAAPWEEDKIVDRLKELAYLNKGVTIAFHSEQTNTKVSWCFDGGIEEYVRDLNAQKDPIFSEIIAGERQDKVVVHDHEYLVRCEVAFQYNRQYTPSIHTFCNNINTIEGGTHEMGFLMAVTRCINKYATEHKLIKDPNVEKVAKEDIMEGLTAIVSIKHPNPQYEGQTKKKLGNSEVWKFVSGVTEAIFTKFLLENPEDARKIVQKTFLASEARKKAAKVKEETRRKSPFESNSLPGKLADCSSRDANVTELYIVEGDSAGGSAKVGREREFQAILPLKGKILNVEKSNYEKILANDEISSLITSIGVGISENYRPENLRYNKIIIMTDADVDGAHIRILLLTFFFRYMKELLINGHVYIAQPPLYKFTVGKKITYAYSDEELEMLKQGTTRYEIQRYKGLGEMNPEQLWETTMDPQNRILLQVTVDDAMMADQMFTLLMGDDVEPRKRYIEEHAPTVKNIDA